ncbi:MULTISPECIES: formate dehydrogenase subunit gamma [Pseudomonas]|jgi:formate dehydrogenase subunit gamma|uniref:Formate dehydrogenase-N, cytochrome B556 (Gamma) subunit, nitrate-inducible n=1 Tax=Pseudomonas marincola TaxID=437900 RepID=A0A653E3I4_9PSED|nr:MULTISPECIES: formate dehydrogenase subunit gamma [Pseudomonas]MAB97300.1 formate dehydrogenase subunit gamma [Pseudomonadaceae bacterium]MBQ57237.1 formate dehydrogenase subunit gamma [Pseudomonadaceae bacterium]OEO23366.1 formate dehydrogenase subunit gamma [Pseudomonas sp. J237]CAE6888635.1 formate dehydrogenase N subunit gamma [Pseudomonas marincola]
MKHDIQRYGAGDRTNHWLVALLFILAGLSGLALFHPALFWLTHLFGGGPWTRILHPIMGVAMFVLFAWLVLRFIGHNMIDANDRKWLSQIGDVVNNHEEKLPPVGRYNGGQKLLFWVLLLCMLVLLVTGVVIWREYFSHLFGIELIRLSVLLHALAAFVLIASIIIHVYAGIWVKGSMGAMLTGWVSRGWARKHHAQWYKEQVSKQEQKP